MSASITTSSLPLGAAAVGLGLQAFEAAMDEARVKLTCAAAVVLHGDKPLVDQVTITLADARELLATMAKGLCLNLTETLVFKELARVAVAFAGLESQCQDNCANAHGLLGAMEGLRHVAKFFLGVEAAAELRPTPAMPADAEPLSTQEAKATFLWDLAKEFAALVTDIKWRYAARAVPAVNESGVDKRRYVSVDADEDLVSHLTGTCADALALLGQMVHKVAGGGFPFTDVAFQEVVSIGKSFVKLQVECAHGSVTSDAVIDAMQALKKMAVVFAGTGVASALRPDSPWSSQGLNDGQNKVAYMWDLSAAFSVLFYDVKFRCVDPKSLK